MRTTGTYAISTTLGEPVQAFVPHALPPAKPVLASESYVEANRMAELARLVARKPWADLGTR